MRFYQKGECFMTPKEYCVAFCEGYFHAQLGEKLTK